MLLNIPFNKKFILFGQAGDPTDQDVKNFVEKALLFNPYKMIAIDFIYYPRGREEFFDYLKGFQD